jgi:23S rRNA maturation-related 3'-5' exoribonuclease YhaM
MSNYTKELIELADKWDVSHLVSPVLDDPRFSTWSGASKEHQHHYGEGGLAKHTWEVVKMCMNTARLYAGMNNMTELETQKLLIAGIWHDYGKIWDYQRIKGEFGENAWEGNDHRTYIRHLTRSAIEWEKFADTTVITVEERDEITHAILAHHGYFEGTPHKPQTKIAVILHMSDNMSARVTDAINGREWK